MSPAIYLIRAMAAQVRVVAEVLQFRGAPTAELDVANAAVELLNQLAPKVDHAFARRHARPSAATISMLEEGLALLALLGADLLDKNKSSAATLHQIEVLSAQCALALTILSRQASSTTRGDS